MHSKIRLGVIGAGSMARRIHVPSFTEIDGAARVWLNGREIGSSERSRQPFQLSAGDALRPGRNVLAVRVDHTKLTELFLGGIIRPVLLIDTAGK